MKAVYISICFTHGITLLGDLLCEYEPLPDCQTFTEQITGEEAVNRELPDKKVLERSEDPASNAD